MRIAELVEGDSHGVDVVLGAAVLDIRPDDRPVRARLVLECHPDAAGVDDADALDDAVELHDACDRITTVRSSIPSSTSRQRSSGESDVRISVSLRGVAWQKSTGPSPSISSVAVSARVAIRASVESSSLARTQSIVSAGARPGAPTSSRSAFPRTRYTGNSSASSAAAVSAGHGPARSSPPSTIASTEAADTSASTA